LDSTSFWTAECDRVKTTVEATIIRTADAIVSFGTGLCSQVIASALVNIVV